MWNQIIVDGCLTFPVNRALLSRDKRLLLDTRNHSGLQENFFENQFSMFDSPRDLPQIISSDDVQRRTAPEPGRTIPPNPRCLHAMLKCESPAAIVELLLSLPPFLASCTGFDQKIGIRLGALEM